MSPDRQPVRALRDAAALLANRWVLLAFLLQLLSYAVLVGVFQHDDPTPLVAALPHLPTPLGALLSVFALPAVAIAIGLNALLEFLLGVSLRSLGVGLVSDDDVSVLVAASLLSVAVGRYLARRRDHDGSVGG